MVFSFAFTPKATNAEEQVSLLCECCSKMQSIKCKFSCIYPVQVGMFFVSSKIRIRNVSLVFDFGSPELNWVFLIFFFLIYLTLSLL